MRISTRNQIPGRVVEVHHGEVMSTVKIEIATDLVVTAAVTREAVEELGLAPGDSVFAPVKATEMAIGVAD